MALLLGLLTASAAGGGLVLRHWHRQDPAARIRDRARLTVVEGQLAVLRAALRITAAEHAARRRLRCGDLFADSPEREEYRPS